MSQRKSLNNTSSSLKKKLSTSKTEKKATATTSTLTSKTTQNTDLPLPSAPLAVELDINQKVILCKEIAEIAFITYSVGQDYKNCQTQIKETLTKLEELNAKFIKTHQEIRKLLEPFHSAENPLYTSTIQLMNNYAKHLQTLIDKVHFMVEAEETKQQVDKAYLLKDWKFGINAYEKIHAKAIALEASDYINRTEYSLALAYLLEGKKTGDDALLTKSKFLLKNTTRFATDGSTDFAVVSEVHDFLMQAYLLLDASHVLSESEFKKSITAESLDTYQKARKLITANPNNIKLKAYLGQDKVSKMIESLKNEQIRVFQEVQTEAKIKYDKTISGLSLPSAPSIFTVDPEIEKKINSKLDLAEKMIRKAESVWDEFFNHPSDRMMRREATQNTINKIYSTTANIHQEVSEYLELIKNADNTLLTKSALRMDQQAKVFHQLIDKISTTKFKQKLDEICDLLLKKNWKDALLEANKIIDILIHQVAASANYPSFLAEAYRLGSQSLLQLGNKTLAIKYMEEASKYSKKVPKLELPPVSPLDDTSTIPSSMTTTNAKVKSKTGREILKERTLKTTDLPTVETATTSSTSTTTSESKSTLSSETEETITEKFLEDNLKTLLKLLNRSIELEKREPQDYKMVIESMEDFYCILYTTFENLLETIKYLKSNQFEQAKNKFQAKIKFVKNKKASEQLQKILDSFNYMQDKVCEQDENSDDTAVFDCQYECEDASDDTDDTEIYEGENILINFDKETKRIPTKTIVDKSRSDLPPPSAPSSYNNLDLKTAQKINDKIELSKNLLSKAKSKFNEFNKEYKSKPDRLLEIQTLFAKFEKLKSSMIKLHQETHELLKQLDHEIPPLSDWATSEMKKQVDKFQALTCKLDLIHACEKTKNNLNKAIFSKDWGSIILENEQLLLKLDPEETHYTCDIKCSLAAAYQILGKKTQNTEYEKKGELYFTQVYYKTRQLDLSTLALKYKAVELFVRAFSSTITVGFLSSDTRLAKIFKLESIDTFKIAIQLIKSNTLDTELSQYLVSQLFLEMLEALKISISSSLSIKKTEDADLEKIIEECLSLHKKAKQFLEKNKVSTETKSQPQPQSKQPPKAKPDFKAPIEEKSQSAEALLNKAKSTAESKHLNKTSKNQLENLHRALKDIKKNRSETNTLHEQIKKLLKQASPEVSQKFYTELEKRDKGFSELVTKLENKISELIEKNQAQQKTTEDALNKSLKTLGEDLQKLKAAREQYQSLTTKISDFFETVKDHKDIIAAAEELKTATQQFIDEETYLLQNIQSLTSGIKTILVDITTQLQKSRLPKPKKTSLNEQLVTFKSEFSVYDDILSLKPNIEKIQDEIERQQEAAQKKIAEELAAQKQKEAEELAAQKQKEAREAEELAAQKQKEAEELALQKLKEAKEAEEQKIFQEKLTHDARALQAKIKFNLTKAALESHTPLFSRLDKGVNSPKTYLQLLRTQVGLIEIEIENFNALYETVPPALLQESFWVAAKNQHQENIENLNALRDRIQQVQVCEDRLQKLIKNTTLKKNHIELLFQIAAKFPGFSLDGGIVAKTQDENYSITDLDSQIVCTAEEYKTMLQELQAPPFNLIAEKPKIFYRGSKVPIFIKLTSIDEDFNFDFTIGINRSEKEKYVGNQPITPAISGKLRLFNSRPADEEKYFVQEYGVGQFFAFELDESYQLFTRSFNENKHIFYVCPFDVNLHRNYFELVLKHRIRWEERTPDFKDTEKKDAKSVTANGFTYIPYHAFLEKLPSYMLTLYRDNQKKCFQSIYHILTRNPMTDARIEPYLNAYFDARFQTSNNPKKMQTRKDWLTLLKALYQNYGNFSKMTMDAMEAHFKSAEKAIAEFRKKILTDDISEACVNEWLRETVGAEKAAASPPPKSSFSDSKENPYYHQMPYFTPTMHSQYPQTYPHSQPMYPQPGFYGPQTQTAPPSQVLFQSSQPMMQPQPVFYRPQVVQPPLVVNTPTHSNAMTSTTGMFSPTRRQKQKEKQWQEQSVRDLPRNG